MATDTALPREQLLARIDELGPRFRERSSRYDREAVFPYENYDDLRDAGLLGVCIPARYGGLGASFADYMHLGARLGEYCAMTALTFNMHCQTVLWTGIAADELDLAPEDRARHEEVRTDLYRRILDSGEIMSQPLSEGVARGATAGVMTEALPVEGGWRVSGRKIFASLSGAASAYNLTVKVPGEEQVRFMSVRADNPGVRIVGDWDTLGMRGTDSRTLLFEEAFVPYADELLPAGVYDQLAERWPYVYMTLTPTYLGLTRRRCGVRARVSRRRGLPARRAAEAGRMGGHPDRPRARRGAMAARRRRGRHRPDARRAAPRLGGVVHGDGDRARGGVEGDPRLWRRLDRCATWRSSSTTATRAAAR